jgi:hypothetical protein
MKIYLDSVTLTLYDTGTLKKYGMIACRPRAFAAQRRQS